MEWLYRVGFTYKGKDYEEVNRFSEKVEPRAVLESFVKEFTKLPNVKTSEIKEIRLFYLSPHDFGNEKSTMYLSCCMQQKTMQSIRKNYSQTIKPRLSCIDVK